MSSWNIKNLFIIAFASSVLIACKSNQEGGTAEPSSKCKAEQLLQLIGKDQGVLKTLTLPDPHRIILPHSVVTADYSETRVNFAIGETGLIESIKCF